MPNVVIVGGGLSGLSAALELQSLNIPYTLIEVKDRLGGSIASRSVDGFVLDMGPFAFRRDDDWSFLADLNLQDELFEVASSRLQPMVAFKSGTQVVIDALAQRLTGPVLYKMAVSSLGLVDGRCAVCLENGLMLDARALIVAAPARYAERMLRTLSPEAALRLLDYRYDTITRVWLGYRQPAFSHPGRLVWDMGLPFFYTVEHPSRVPPEHILLHLGVRYPLDKTTPTDLIRALQTQLNLPDSPVVSLVSVWSEADPLPPHDKGFDDDIAALERLLPGQVALAGSDYAGLSLAQRFESGKQAARKIVAHLSD